MWFCGESNSEQLLILNFMLKIRSYSSGNRRNFGKMSGIFAPFSEEFLSFSKIWLYLTLKNAISCHLRQKIEKMARQELQKVRKEKNQKMCHFETGTYFSISILFVFFFDPDYLYELFGGPIEPFFRFFVLNGRRSHFLVSNIAKFC